MKEKNKNESAVPHHSSAPVLHHSVCIIGCWHQGVVGAACLADLGCDVLGADHDSQRVANLNSGKAPLFEPGLDELLQKGIRSGRLKFTAEVANSVKGRRDVLIMFDTPVDANDQSDLSEIFLTVAGIAPNLENDSVLFVTAQVPVGTCDRLAAIIREKNPSLKFDIAYSPENLRLGQAIDRFLHPAMPVIGADDDSTLDRVEQLLAPLKAKWERVNLRTAEMAKHALNAFLATSVAFANEIGNICDEVGADGKRLAEVLRLEERIGRKAVLFPGLGFSGGTLARDVQTLRELGRTFGLDTLMLDGIWESNKIQNRLVIRKLKKVFGSLKQVPVTVLGLTYKPDTSTLRRSVSLEIIADLQVAQMKVRAHDPKADRAEVSAHKEFLFFEDVYDALKDARAAVLITGWADYKQLDFERVKKVMAEPVILDIPSVLDANRLQALGFTYMDIGRGRWVEPPPSRER